MGNDHRHHQTVNKKQLILAIVISFCMMLVEIGGGVWTNSLALISDAFHMFTHIFALTVSYMAARMTERPPSGSQSFGYHRAETIAAAINGFFLVLVTGIILYEAAMRFSAPAEIAEFEMLMVAVAGLCVNLITAVILMRADRENINIRGAFLHMIGDAASSVGIIVAGVVIYYTNWYYLDPAASVIIALVILYWAFNLIRDATRILMQATPRHIDIAALRHILTDEFRGVRDVHDIHIWELSQNMYVFSAHVVTEDFRISEAEQIGGSMADMLRKRFRITHTNFQFETNKSLDICTCNFHHA